ncbi:MAG: FecR family protein [Prolixibacteraceae bacterium]|nr:FecR family protein [Prolixibacteraceae bacterium]
MKNAEFSNIEFKSLLEKFQSGKSNPEELRLLEEMFFDGEISEGIKSVMLNEIKDFETAGSATDTDYDRLFQSIQKIISDHKSKTRGLNLRLNFMRIAAIIVMAFVFGGTLSYFIFNSDKKAPSSFCEVTAPLGSTSEIVLPDSSRVWLNAGSKIKYSTTYNQKNRLIYLEGEGYFIVAKNKKIPFIVDAYGFEVKAVGTEFNVKAYKGDPTVETTMVEGKVTLQHSTESILKGVYLTPNQKATFYKKEESLTVEVIKKLEEKKEELNYIPEHRLVIAPRIDPKAIISWKENRLIIEREQLGTLAEILSRKYNFNFEFKSEDIKQISFSGTLEDETLQQVMNVIKISSPIDYEIVGKTVIIERNEARMSEFKKLYKQK